MGPIDISSWPRDEDYPVFPVGSKPKRMVRAPDNVASPLISGHSYLFKTATDWLQQQVWSEVIAAELGAILGLPVPRCFIACDGTPKAAGALIEFFYGYPGEPAVARLVHGSDLLASMFPQAKQRGRPHALKLNVGICKRFASDDAVEWWARAVTFDALIGNTDRHTENWGLLARLVPLKGNSITIAPAFDNGTSLGYEQREEAIATPWNERKLEGYAAKGRHHFSWDQDDERVRGHIDLCRRYALAYPNARKVMRNVIRFDREQITSIVEPCTHVDVGIKFSPARAQFVTDLIMTRQRLIRTALGDGDD